jgi:hypothetical protein
VESKKTASTPELGVLIRITMRANALPGGWLKIGNREA